MIRSYQKCYKSIVKSEEFLSFQKPQFVWTIRCDNSKLASNDLKIGEIRYVHRDKNASCNMVSLSSYAYLAYKDMTPVERDENKKYWKMTPAFIQGTGNDHILRKKHYSSVRIPSFDRYICTERFATLNKAKNFDKNGMKGIKIQEILFFPCTKNNFF